MAVDNKGGWGDGFAMPMFREWVPARVRPWLYVWLALTFQLSGGVYLGALSEMMGEMSLMREDLLMCLYASLCGLAFTFPVLFRTKFRFTNRTLLLFSALGMAACNVAAMFVSSLPLLWLVCFVAGCLKIQGTFECLSNIQLWLTPRRDFRVFFPLLHLWIMLAIPVSDLMAVYLCHVATWRCMPLLVAGVMLFNALWLFVCTRHFRFMRLPFLAIDWLGALMWVLAVMQTVYIFCYGEFYNWWDSDVIRTLTVTALLTFALAVFRMFLIRHPYIEPGMWRNRKLPAILVLAFVIEALLATEHVLEEVFYESGMEWHGYTSAALDVPTMCGCVCACIFALLWLKVCNFGRVRLIAVGLSAFIAHALVFYFTLSADVSMSHLYLPVFLRGFAATLLAVVMLCTIQAAMNFMVFFQSLAIFQTVHLLIGGVVGAACYAYGLRRIIADGVSRYGSGLDRLGVAAADMPCRVGEIMTQLQIAGVKQIYGIVAYVAAAVLVAVLIYDMPLSRERNGWMPSWTAVGKVLRRRLAVTKGRK